MVQIPNKPISIEFTAETDAYERDLKKAEKATQRLADTLEKDIPKASDKMADEARQDFNRLEADAADAGGEVGDEFKQNLGQSLASGDMSALLTDTLGGLVAGLKGPVGLAGAAVAGVAALAFTEVKKQAEELKAFTESLSGALASLYDQGIKTQDKMRRLEAFNTFLEDQADKIQDLEDDWDATGVSQEKYLTAIFEGGPALDEQRRKIMQVIAATEAQAKSAEGPTQRSLEQNAAAQELLRYLDAQGVEQADLTEEMNNQAAASQELAKQYGLVDVNLDGVVDGLDDAAIAAGNLASGTGLSLANLTELKGILEAFPTTIPVEVVATMSDATRRQLFPYGTAGGGTVYADRSSP